mmetsp:Transcript_28412/g.60240  ORF Transcript_28412/g.60240 Transcript_28412/m.60240 type:complete len:216 (-) Transcript_28412:525-1172(-)
MFTGRRLGCGFSQRSWAPVAHGMVRRRLCRPRQCPFCAGHRLARGSEAAPSLVMASAMWPPRQLQRRHALALAPTWTRRESLRVPGDRRGSEVWHSCAVALQQRPSSGSAKGMCAAVRAPFSRLRCALPRPCSLPLLGFFPETPDRSASLESPALLSAPSTLHASARRAWGPLVRAPAASHAARVPMVSPRLATRPTSATSAAGRAVPRPRASKP